jgi:hypothetical protein
MTPDTSRVFTAARMDAMRTEAWANRLKVESKRHAHNQRVLHWTAPSISIPRPCPTCPPEAA